MLARSNGNVLARSFAGSVSLMLCLAVLAACGQASSSATSAPSPVPTATQAPAPTEVPASTDTPSPTIATTFVKVPRFWCKTLDDALAAIVADGFIAGTVTSSPPGTDPIPPTWIVLQQDPQPDLTRAPGIPINLEMADPASSSAVSACS